MRRAIRFGVWQAASCGVCPSISSVQGAEEVSSSDAVRQMVGEVVFVASKKEDSASSWLKPIPEKSKTKIVRIEIYFLTIFVNTFIRKCLPSLKNEFPTIRIITEEGARCNARKRENCHKMSKVKRKLEGKSQCEKKKVEVKFQCEKREKWNKIECKKN